MQVKAVITFIDYNGQEITRTIEYDEGHTVLSEGALVIVAARGETGQVHVEAFDPLYLDRHPDSLRSVGGQVMNVYEAAT